MFCADQFGAASSPPTLLGCRDHRVPRNRVRDRCRSDEQPLPLEGASDGYDHHGRSPAASRSGSGRSPRPLRRARHQYVRGSHFPKTADREDFLVRVTDDHNDYRFRLSLTGFALLYQTTSLIVASINRSQPSTPTPITAVPGRDSLGRMEPAVRLTRRWTQRCPVVERNDVVDSADGRASDCRVVPVAVVHLEPGVEGPGSGGAIP